MYVVFTVLSKTIVGQYYRQNAGLLAVVFLIAGSFLRAIEHITLAQIAVHSGFVLALYLVLWTLYTLYVTRFAVGVFRQYAVLYHLRLLPFTTRLLSLWICQLQLLLPVLVYAGFVLGISIQEKTYSTSAWLLVSVFLLTTLPLLWVAYVLRHPHPERTLATLRISIGQRFTTPYGLFFIRHLIHRQPIMLFLTKTGTLLVTLGVLLLYPTDNYDSRLLELGILFVAAGHVALVYQLYQFEHERLAIYRNLPISSWHRLVRYSLILAGILLPEGLLLIRNRPIDLSFIMIIGIWLFGHSLLLLQFAFLLRKHHPLDKLLVYLFWLIIGSFFLIMYQLPIWLLTAVCWSVGSWLFLKYYWQSVWEVD